MQMPNNQYGRKRTKKLKPIITQTPAEPAVERDRPESFQSREKPEAQLPMELPVPELKIAPPLPAPTTQTVSELKSSPESKPDVVSKPASESRPDAKREAPLDRQRRDIRRPEHGERYHQPHQQERSQQQERPIRQERPEQQERKRDPQALKPRERQMPRKLGVERGKVRVSIIIPAFNEEGNIKPLMDQFHEVIARAGNDWEVILVDDGSTDKTADRARDAAIHYHWLRVISYPKNRGLTAALDIGFQNARGSIFVFYPADLQYHPQDIPKMIMRIDRGADIVTGWKQGTYSKQFVSSIYNYICRTLFGVKVHDLNSVKAFKKEVLDKVKLRRDWHRYMVVLAAEEGYAVDEVKVNVYPRYSGKSKFGTGRVLGGVLDLLSVKFQISFTKKPLRFFGTWGLVSILLGIITGLVAIYLRFFTVHGSRIWLYLVILFVLSGLMLFSLGFLAEVIVSIREEIELLKRTK